MLRASPLLFQRGMAASTVEFKITPFKGHRLESVPEAKVQTIQKVLPNERFQRSN